MGKNIDIKISYRDIVLTKIALATLIYDMANGTRDDDAAKRTILRCETLIDYLDDSVKESLKNELE